MRKLFIDIDGANCQAKAVLAFLDHNDGLECSWDREKHRYLAEPTVSRWENCREQGYVISLKKYSSNKCKQLNIAFFEHRNSDQLCAVKWEQFTINSPTIDTADFGDIYKNKYDVSFSVGYGEILKMTTWIYRELELFWKAEREK